MVWGPCDSTGQKQVKGRNIVLVQGSRGVKLRDVGKMWHLLLWEHVLKAIEITVGQEAERDRPGYNVCRSIPSDPLPYLLTLPRVSSPAKLALHFSDMSQGVAWSISVLNHD